MILTSVLMVANILCAAFNFDVYREKHGYWRLMAGILNSAAVVACLFQINKGV